MLPSHIRIAYFRPVFNAHYYCERQRTVVWEWLSKTTQKLAKTVGRQSKFATLSSVLKTVKFRCTRWPRRDRWLCSRAFHRRARILFHYRPPVPRLERNTEYQKESQVGGNNALYAKIIQTRFDTHTQLAAFFGNSDGNYYGVLIVVFSPHDCVVVSVIGLIE
jgi:hypothetical protein